jgi:hypothetical protein
MSFFVVNKENQKEYVFNGEIFENKPLAFPQDRGDLKPYSNLFYLANLYSDYGGIIPNHSHVGFEILTLVIKGTYEYQVAGSKEWKKLLSGDVQVLRAGKGFQHSEKYGIDTQVFQIWLNPDLTKTLLKQPVLLDYGNDDFPHFDADKKKIKTIIGSGSDIELDSYGTRVKEISFFTGNHALDIEPNAFYSIYCLRGAIEISGYSLVEDDFLLVNEEFNLEITAAKDSKLLMIETPDNLSYLTYFQMYPNKYKS